MLSCAAFIHAASVFCVARWYVRLYAVILVECLVTVMRYDLFLTQDTL
jgi:hypothetical protein